MRRETVTDQDLRLLRRLIDPARPSSPDEDIAQSLLVDLAELIGCEDVTLQVMDFRARYARVQSTYDEGDDDPELENLFWETFWDCLSCSYPQRTGDSQVTRDSDFHTGFPDPFLEAIGRPHEMLVPLPVPDRLDHRLLLFRHGGPDFSERDVLLLTLLQPHLTELHTRQLRRQRGMRDLTPRQWEILRLVASGCTNRQVGRALGLTERTVSKHLENIYLRVGAQSRTEAIAAAGIRVATR